jgi:demethylmenaquinone methyltransferase/2-methoxy-6-polyprenyl-1,4-benzoquinol methylase
MTSPQDQERARDIQSMFGRIAGRYDVMNRLMTFGQDMRWRRFVVDKAALRPDSRLLDLAVGTGDIAMTALHRFPEATVVGADFALPMMQVGRHRPSGASILWCQGDALALPFPDGAFDAIVSGYLLRNVVDLRQGLAEQVRVLRPGGTLVALDTTPPPRNLFRPFIEIHLRFVIPTLGRLIANAPDAYAYLPNSTEAFLRPDDLVSVMDAAGLVNVQYRTFMLGTMAVHWGSKPPA